MHDLSSVTRENVFQKIAGRESRYYKHSGIWWNEIGVKFQKELKVVSLKERFYRKQILIYLGKYIVYVMYIQY